MNCGGDEEWFGPYTIQVPMPPTIRQRIWERQTPIKGEWGTDMPTDTALLQEAVTRLVEVVKETGVRKAMESAATIMDEFAAASRDRE